MDLRVAALHRLPFDTERFAKDMEAVADHDADIRAELEEQYRENWNNAWIIVVEYPAAENLHFDFFNHPEPGPNAQAAWLEQELAAEGITRRAAFFMHYVDRARPLWYGDQPLDFPEPMPAPESLLEMMPYSSPD